jgi:hypothetical protein
MAIIYTYPTVTPSLTDKVLISGEDNKTENATITSILNLLPPQVDSFTSAFGTYISGTNNSSSTGNVSIGTVDLNAVNGTAVSATRFLSKDNTWDVPPIYSGGANVGYVPSGGTVGQYLGGDGQWATASGSGTVTGTGANNQIATWTSASNIDGDSELTYNNSTGTLKVGEFGSQGGIIIAAAEDGVQSGILSMEHKSGGTYLNLKVGDAAMSSTYNLVFPSNVASATGKVLKSTGANGILEWADDSAGTIGGTIQTTGIPVGTATNTIGASIMTQQVAALNPTHYRVRISNPPSSATPATTFPSLQFYNSNTGSYPQGTVLSEITSYSADPSGSGANPHICSFIKTVQGQAGTNTATDGELVFGTAPYNTVGDALESMRVDRDGSILVSQVGISTDANYRTGIVKVQGTGAFRLYSSSFTGNSMSISRTGDTLEIGDKSSFSGDIKFYTDGSLAYEINDQQESIFKGPATIPLGTAAAPSLRFPTPGNTTGIYSSGVNSLDIAGSGVAVASFASTAITLKQDLTIQEETTIEKDLTVTKHITGNGQFTLTENPVTQSGSTATCDLRGGNQFRIASMNSAITVTFSNAQSGDEFTLSVTRTANGANQNITWANAYWPGGVNPGQTNTANKIDIYKFTKVGSSIYGRVVGLNYTQPE